MELGSQPGPSLVLVLRIEAPNRGPRGADSSTASALAPKECHQPEPVCCKMRRVALCSVSYGRVLRGLASSASANFPARLSHPPFSLSHHHPSLLRILRRLFSIPSLYPALALNQLFHRLLNLQSRL